MGADEKFSLREEPVSEMGDNEILKVSFPYSLPSVAEEVSVPQVKIDYSAIAIPPPKKTISVRRASPKTRVVRIDEDYSEKKYRESSPSVSADSKSEEISGTLQKVLKSVGTISLAAQESQRQYASIAADLQKQTAILPKIDALQRHLDQSHKVETANQRLFDAMHEELKGYKDNFLFDALQKPMIRDLLVIFDDLGGQAQRIAQFLADTPTETDAEPLWTRELKTTHNNLSNTVFFLMEMLNRLDVTILEGDNEWLDLKRHKVISFEPTSVPEEKNQIARVLRTGFLWRERILRPTEVVVKRYNEPEG